MDKLSTSEKLDISEELEIKTKLEKALKGRLTPTQWDFLKDQGVLETYVTSPLEEELEQWKEFERGAVAALKQLQTWYERLRKEEGEGYSTPDSFSSKVLKQPLGLTGRTPGSKRTAARTEALSAYNRLHAQNGAKPNRPAMEAALFPRGGTDGTIAQWVYVLLVELWVPAEEVKADYLDLQQELTEERARKADPRTLEVTRFVWEEQKRAEGKNLSYPELMKRWNETQSKASKFKKWRSFRNAFIRGREAALPRYEGSADLLHKGAEEGYGKNLFDSWASDVRATF